MPKQIKIQIEMPFWIEIPNRSKFTKKLADTKYDIELFIEQDYWKVYAYNNREYAAYIPEKMLIHPYTLKYRPNLRISPELDIKDNNYHPEKNYSLFVYIIDFGEEMAVNIEFMKEIFKKVKNDINKFLQIYSFIKLNSKFKSTSIIPLNSGYYNNGNTLVYLLTEDKKWELYEFTNLLFDFPYYTPFPQNFIENNALKLLKTKYEGNYTIKSRDNIRGNINLAVQSKNMNIYIIFIAIAIETLIQPFLLHKRHFLHEEVDAFLSEEGLRAFVKYQLPHFYGKEKEDLTSACFEIVRYRNEILHKGANHKWSESKYQVGEKAIEMINFLESELEIESIVWDISENYVIGYYKEPHPEISNLHLIQMLGSYTESLFHKWTQLTFTETIINQVQQIFLKNFEGKEVKIDTHKENKQLYMYQSKFQLFIFIIPFSDMEANKKIVDDIMSSSIIEKMDEIHIFAVFKQYPLQNLNELFEYLEKIAEEHKEKVTINFRQFYVILTNICREVISLYQEKNTTKLSVEDVHQYLLSKNLVEDFEYFDMMVQNVISLSKEGKKKYYLLNPSFKKPILFKKD